VGLGGAWLDVAAELVIAVDQLALDPPVVNPPLPRPEIRSQPDPSALSTAEGVGFHRLAVVADADGEQPQAVSGLGDQRLAVGTGHRADGGQLLYQERHAVNLDGLPHCRPQGVRRL